MKLPQHAIDHSIDAVFYMTDEGRFSYVNLQACKSLNYSKDELLDMGLYDIDVNIQKSGFPEFCESVKENGLVIDESAHIRKNGKHVTVEASYSYVEIEGERCLCAFAKDIGKRKQTELMLRQSEKKYRELVERANSIILKMDTEGCLTFINKFGQKFFGFSKEEILGKNVVGTIVPEIESSGKNLSDMISGIGRNPKKFANNENENICRDGKRVRVAWTNSGIIDENDTITGVLCIGNDVTERKNLEAQLWQTQKMEAIGELAGGIAHDFNNILSIIMSSAEMMELQDLNGNDRAKKRLGRIFNASKRGEKLVYQILSFIRSDEQQKNVFTVNHNIKETLDFLSTTLPATITIKERIHHQPLKMFGNPTQINQVLINLCTNAKHAMENKKGVLGINLGHIDINRPALYKGNPIDQGRYILLSVKDSGHGMDQTVIDRIFNPFFTTKPKEEGTGLGLSMVDNIIKDHGGQVIVKSQCGKGSEFHVFLPLYEGPDNRAEQSQKTIPKEISVINTVKRILLVDDEQDVTDAWKALLESIGYEVTSRTSGVEALKSFQSQPDRFDLVITDNNMPHMCGNEVARCILKTRANMPIIFCSGTINETVQEKFKNHSNILFLRKPVTLELLNENIRQLIG